ncbi:protein FAM221B [Trichechus manatus latirostris]|uniref:Protein FAM221B n=1 Tax=Trichechus manatus latirostris TaxID=127582 RepID=A0A2Y9DD82_TRIMA|nr:protein FAM221B [Trichechus manatus latirostris]
MEADKVTEELYTTMDAEEHPSSKNPSTEDLQEPPISEDPLESSNSETPLEPHITKSPLVPPTSKTPLETHTSETLLEAHTSETILEYSISETPPKTPIYEAPVESHISKGPEKRLSSNPSSEDHVSASSSKDDALREDLYTESSFNEIPRARKSTLEVPEPVILKKHSLSGRSAQVHKDTSVGQKEEAEEDKEGVVAIDSTAHTPQPGHQLDNTVHPVVPAKQAELVEVAKAMHRDQFGAQVDHLFQWEKHAALSAIQTGLYIGWRCPHYLWDCFRIGDESKCFCGHLLKEHQINSDISVPCGVSQCRCLMFCFIPSRPEEVGEFWLTRRATFDPKAWRAQCRCKHSHEDHTATGSHPCRHYGCCCNCFESNFLCAACDRRWEEHETFFETKETRRRGGRPHGADYVPFAEMPALRKAILRNSDFKALEPQGPSGHSSSHPGPPGPPGPHSPQSGPTSDPHT